jgi:hypothetical protein
VNRDGRKTLVTAVGEAYNGCNGSVERCSRDAPTRE